jgi:predicted RNA-binding Zn ribbon-like protein
VALTTAAALVNTLRYGYDALPDVAALARFLYKYEVSGVRAHSIAELSAVRGLRTQLRGVWDSAEGDAAATLVNDLLEAADARPRLAQHDGWGWHLHFSRPEAPLARRLGAELAMGLADLLRNDDLDRLRHCRAPDCTSVLIDMSRNRSRMYCDTGNCGNRQHVAAYRARRTAPPSG